MPEATHEPRQDLERELSAEWMTVRQAAVRLDLSTQGVYWLIQQGRLKAMDTPGVMLVSQAEVERFAAEKRAKKGD